MESSDSTWWLIGTRVRVDSAGLSGKSERRGGSEKFWEGDTRMVIYKREVGGCDRGGRCETMEARA